MSKGSLMQFFGASGIPRRKKKPVIVEEPEDEVETNSSDNWSPSKKED